MTFENWYEKILKNRKSIIEYYVQQFGEEKREKIEERFDSIKFCFYIDPEYIKTWLYLQLNNEFEIETYNFFKEFGSEFGIDKSSISLKYNKRLGYIFIGSNNQSTEKKINNIFRGAISYSGISDDYQFSDLYSFRDMKDFIKGEGKDYKNPEKELTERRLLFLKDMGDITISGRPLDFFETEECKDFINSSRYKELCEKYSRLASIACLFKKRVDSKYESLREYMKKSLTMEEQIIKKYDKLKNTESDPSKVKEYERECKKEIASSRIICGNFDMLEYPEEYLDNILDCIVDSGDTQTTHSSYDDTKKMQERIIFFCPFKSVPGYEDVDLRHEIRHGITSSVNEHNGIVSHKTGNKIERFVDGEMIESNLDDWNEWVTQSEAKKETKTAFANGIYIISKPSIINQDSIGQTSDYDRYLETFEIIYNALPLEAKRSQIDESNSSLYDIISKDQLEKVEKMIRSGNPAEIEELNILASSIKEGQNADSTVAKR